MFANHSARSSSASGSELNQCFELPAGRGLATSSGSGSLWWYMPITTRPRPRYSSSKRFRDWQTALVARLRYTARLRGFHGGSCGLRASASCRLPSPVLSPGGSSLLVGGMAVGEVRKRAKAYPDITMSYGRMRSQILCPSGGAGGDGSMVNVGGRGWQESRNSNF
jgi:hypothetical protein